MKRLLHSLVVGAAAAALHGTASAQLEIVLEFDERKSDSPTWDRDGSCLTATLEAAAEYWESLFTGIPAHQIDIRFRWFDHTAHPTFGLTPLEWGHWADTRRRTGFLSPNKYNMRFWTVTSSGTTSWFVDDDPSEHSEFEMTPRLFQWPYDSGTVTGLSGAVVGAVEVGFEGAARSAATAVPACGEYSARDGVDLYTVALHEIGHALGLGFRGESDAKSDGVYDVDSPLHGGLDIQAALTSRGDIDPGHLRADYALMYPAISAGRRRLPSMIDVLAVADINLWTSFEFPRHIREYNAFPRPWNNTVEWLAGVTPSAGQGVDFYTDPNDSVWLTASVDVDGLYIGELMELDVRDESLDAGERIALANSSSLLVDDGSLMADLIIHHGDLVAIAGSSHAFVSKFVEMDGSASLVMTGAAGSPALLYVPSGFVHLAGSAELRPFRADLVTSRLELDGASTRFDGGFTHVSDLLELVNDGVIAANNGNLTFDPAAAGVFFDLDGDATPEVGRIEALGGSIDFGAPALDPFGGQMKIGAGRSIIVSTSLPVDGGTIEFSGDDSHLNCGNLDMRFGLVSVSGPVGTDAFIHGVQTWGSIGTMSVATGNGLHLLGVSNYRGGIVAGGSGLVRQAGDAFVHATPEPTRIEVSRYLWDGELPSGGGGAASDTTVLAGAKLYITGAIGTSALDGFDGTVYVQNGAELFVEDNWILEGELVLEGGRILAGGILTNRGSIRGYGSIETMVLNEGDIECDGGSLLWCGSCYVDAGGTCGPAGCCPP